MDSVTMIKDSKLIVKLRIHEKLRYVNLNNVTLTRLFTNGYSDQNKNFIDVDMRTKCLHSQAPLKNKINTLCLSCCGLFS